MDLVLDAQIGALVAPATGIVWRKDGQVLGTNGTLTLTNVPFTASGEYRVSVVTPFQTFTSAPVPIEVVPLVVTIEPTALSVRPGSNLLFSAATIGIGPMDYQWQFQGTNVPGATGENLAIANAQLMNEGEYRVIAANAYGAVTSAPARLRILINPSVVIRPLNQSVVAGGEATFSFMIAGHPPPFGYLLRKSSSVLTNYVTDERLGFLSLFNIKAGDAGTYRVVVTNAANPSPGLTFDPVALTVLADSDNDRLPDNWEAQYPAAGSATGDADGDGLSNLQEYLAGTDPLDKESFLKVSAINLAGEREAAVIQFRAVSNKTYTVQVRNRATGEVWNRLADVVATPTNRIVSITNCLNRNDVRFYRLF
jgi:hypothetical protein